MNNFELKVSMCVLMFLLILKIKHKINQIVECCFFIHPKQVPYQAEPRADFLYVIDITSILYRNARTISNAIYAHLCSIMQAKTYECVNKSVITVFEPQFWLLIKHITSNSILKFKSIKHISWGKSGENKY